MKKSLQRRFFENACSGYGTMLEPFWVIWNKKPPG
jgi:hypothetical protein